MLQGMSSQQLTELEAYWESEGGWGDYKRDYLFAQLCTIIAEPNRDKDKKPQPFKIIDFLMRPKEKPKEETLNKQIRMAFESLTNRKKKK